MPNGLIIEKQIKVKFQKINLKKLSLNGKHSQISKIFAKSNTLEKLKTIRRRSLKKN